MFYNSANGLQLETSNGWAISVSLSGAQAKEDCEIAVWPVGYGDQKDWVRWGANGAEAPDFPIFDRVLGGLTTTDLLRVIHNLSTMPISEVVPDKWLSKGLIAEAKWR